MRSSVDLEGGFVTVKTAKTGETVEIPIFPLQRSLLEKALAKPAPRLPVYAFPELEAHYRLNADHLTDRVRRVMKAAGFFNPKDETRQPTRGAVQQDRSAQPAEAFNLGELRAKLVAMEDSTWRHIRDELLGRLPAEKNVTPPQPALLKRPAAA
ncbi:MAG: hypothetical protein HS122_12285 [Opitutaceae bacterium]|nr:hypothetical protein [Opitutaceae bacterium]